MTVTMAADDPAAFTKDDPEIRQYLPQLVKDVY